MICFVRIPWSLPVGTREKTESSIELLAMLSVVKRLSDLLLFSGCLRKLSVRSHSQGNRVKTTGKFDNKITRGAYTRKQNYTRVLWLQVSLVCSQANIFIWYVCTVYMEVVVVCTDWYRST